ncbi:MAG: hypothetical protein GQ579_09850 [Bacteroidales bacterium]|nr:hypothetical protein [Bacteroidales bacterium]
MLKLVQRKEIDILKWDDLIAHSPAETIYPYSWYLDTVAENWSALVVDDYRFVMPVVWKKKAGMKYIYQPFYTQQLGVYSREYVDPELIRKMLRILYKKFRFAGMNFNAKNLVGEEKPFTVDDKSNYVMTLNQDYETLYNGFSINAKRNIRKSIEFSEQVERNLPVEELVRLKRENDVIPRSKDDYSWMVRLFETIHTNGKGKIYAIRTGSEINAAAFFAFSKTRAIYLLSASSQKGKEQRGMFRIVDTFINDFAGSGMILDFEGSNIPSVARFFGGFGAQADIYQSVSFNRLPVTLTKLR